MELRGDLAGSGSLCLIGGGEFSFGETVEADRAWVSTAPEGRVGFLPTASGSSDYVGHFREYLEAAFDRAVEAIPVYRGRDARRGKNAERIASCSAVYLGGGIADQLLDTLRDTPVLTALEDKLRSGGTIVAIAAAAQALGAWSRSLTGRDVLPGLGWLAGGVIEPNFDPAHDRRFRQSLSKPGARWGVGLPPGSGLLFEPDGVTRSIGPLFPLTGPDDDLKLTFLASAEEE